MRKKITIGIILCLLVIAGIFAFLYFNKEEVGKIDAFPDLELNYNPDSKEYDIGGLIVKKDFHPMIEPTTTDDFIYYMNGTLENKNVYKLYNVKLYIDFYDQDLNIIDSFSITIKSINANSEINVNEKYVTKKGLAYRMKINKIEGYRR